MVKFRYYLFGILTVLLMLLNPVETGASRVIPEPMSVRDHTAEQAKSIRKVLFIGDSMTGWMAERLNAYGAANGFEVATIVWDGSTIRKWGGNQRLKQIIAGHNPDAVFISLGLNELYMTNPQATLNTQINNILSAVGNRGLLWIGPPSWPGKQIGRKMDAWLADRVGEGRYFSSLNLKIPRQSRTNPHPTRAGIITWMDEVIEWIPHNTDLKFRSLNKPADRSMSRGKTYIYKRMRETL
ncbi:MAG: hypothetical protein K2H86_03440 [Muribaculaceae bacterium]|nr:hypothetical protein [Muribaculaceae bacterium]